MEPKSPFLHCLIGGLLLLTCLITCKQCDVEICLLADPSQDLTLRLNEELPTSLHVTFVFLIIVATTLLIHGIARICLAAKKHRVSRLRSDLQRPIRRPHRHRRHHPVLRLHYPEPASPFDALPEDDSVYSPQTPVRVHLLYDEEAMLQAKGEVHPHPHPSSTETLLTPPPPAYGLWRCSVRADPNLLHWERSEATKQTQLFALAGVEMVETPEAGRTWSEAVRRPPSYASNGAGADLAGLDIDGTGEGGPRVEIIEDAWRSRRQSLAVEEVSRMLRDGVLPE